jgi:hypothetical protein
MITNITQLYIDTYPWALCLGYKVDAWQHGSMNQTTKYILYIYNMLNTTLGTITLELKTWHINFNTMQYLLIQSQYTFKYILGIFIHMFDIFIYLIIIFINSRQIYVIIEYDTLHQIWIHISNSMTLDVYLAIPLIQSQYTFKYILGISIHMFDIFIYLIIIFINLRQIYVIIEYDTLHQIWIHIRNSMTLDVFLYHCVMMVLCDRNM